MSVIDELTIATLELATKEIKQLQESLAERDAEIKNKEEKIKLLLNEKANEVAEQFKKYPTAIPFIMEKDAEIAELKSRQTYTLGDYNKLKKQVEKLERGEEILLTVFKGLEKGIKTVPDSFPHGDMKFYFRNKMQKLGEK